jgi:hypothetical protein
MEVYEAAVKFLTIPLLVAMPISMFFVSGREGVVCQWRNFVICIS